MKNSAQKIRTSHVGRLPVPQGFEQTALRLTRGEVGGEEVAAQVVPVVADVVTIVCIVLPYAALVTNPFLRCALHNVHVVDYAEALARAISADDNRFGHWPGRKWPNRIAF